MRDRGCFALGVIVLLAAPLSRFIVGGQAAMVLAGSLVYFAGWLEKPDAVSPPPSSPEELEHD